MLNIFIKPLVVVPVFISENMNGTIENTFASDALNCRSRPTTSPNQHSRSEDIKRSMFQAFFTQSIQKMSSDIFNKAWLFHFGFEYSLVDSNRQKRKKKEKEKYNNKIQSF